MDILGQKSVMNELSSKELSNISGGLSISGTLINSFIKGIDVVLEVGRSLGTAIRRSMEKNICPL